MSIAMQVLGNPVNVKNERRIDDEEVEQAEPSAAFDAGDRWIVWYVAARRDILWGSLELRGAMSAASSIIFATRSNQRSRSGNRQPWQERTWQTKASLSETL